MDVALPHRLNMRARRVDHEHNAEIEALLRRAGRKPTVTAILRHALAEAAAAARGDALAGEASEGVAAL